MTTYMTGSGSVCVQCVNWVSCHFLFPWNETGRFPPRPHRGLRPVRLFDRPHPSFTRSPPLRWRRRGGNVSTVGHVRRVLHPLLFLLSCRSAEDEYAAPTTSYQEIWRRLFHSHRNSPNLTKNICLISHRYVSFLVTKSLHTENQTTAPEKRTCLETVFTWNNPTDVSTS